MREHGEEEELLQHVSAAVDTLRRFVVIDERTKTERFFVPPTDKAVKAWRSVDQLMRKLKRRWDKIVDARLALQKASTRWRDTLSAMELAVENLQAHKPDLAEGYADGHTYSTQFM